MLQRTRADQVATVYSEFIERYPTLEKACSAPAGEMRSLLKPLGLNWRIGSIIKLVNHLKINGMRIPSTYEDLRQLPGVGEYTARAVMTYAYMHDSVALDVNVMRIISRFFGVAYKKGSKPTNAIRQLAAGLVLRGRSKDLNMALMDFAALVCRERDPLCAECPLNDRCS